ncbi:MAG TPA: hypothetical protein VJ747_15025 [Stellaceae bacterium]|nr:hypothetical protein [Stellaceae bacterium]
MNSKLSFLTRAAAVAGIVALAVPALAQSNTPAPASTQAAPVAKADSKAKKTKSHTAKKHDSMMKTAKTDTGHKPAPAKTEAPASNAGK